LREAFADVTPDHVGPGALLVAFRLGGVAVIALAVELAELRANLGEPLAPVVEQEASRVFVGVVVAVCQRAAGARGSR